MNDKFAGTPLGRSLSAPAGGRASRPDEDREARRARREARKAKQEADARPILNLDAEVTDEDAADAIASITASHDEAEALASILAMFQPKENT